MKTAPFFRPCAPHLEMTCSLYLPTLLIIGFPLPAYLSPLTTDPTSMPAVTKILQGRPYGLRWRSSAWFITLGTPSPALGIMHADQLCVSHTSRWDGYVCLDADPEHHR